MRVHKFVLSLIICEILIVNAYSQTEKMTLRQCIDYALIHNYSLQSAKLDEEISQQRSREIAAAGFPQINGNGFFDDNLKIPVSAISSKIFNPNAPETFVTFRFGTHYMATGNITLDQVIYQGNYWVGVKASKVSRIYYNQAKEHEIENTIYRVAQAYYHSLILTRQIEMQESNVNSTKELLRIINVQFEQDVKPKTERDRVLVDYNNQLAELRKLQRSSQTSLNQLKYEMGMPLEENIQPEDVMNDDSILHEGTDTPSGADYNHRIEYQILKTQHILNGLDLKQFSSGFHPTLNGYARYQYQAFRSEFNFFDPKQPWYNSQTVGLKLSIPIYDGFRKNAQIQQAKLNIRKTETQMNMLQQSINLETSNALSNYLNSVESVHLEKENLKLAQEVFDNAKNLYQQGVGSYYDFVNSENALRIAQLNYTNSLLNVHLAKTDLSKAQGKIKELLNEF